jgi:peptidoglycan-associated lipoprotein
MFLGACRSNQNNNDLVGDDLNGPGNGWSDVDLVGEELGSRDGFPSTPVATPYEPVYFGYDSSSVTTGETYKVQQVAQHLNANPRHAVIVQGHTDERGSREYNLALGERRALAVRQVLMSLGISPDRIQTLSYGEEMPAVPGFDESAWSMNRRAEFQLMQ